MGRARKANRPSAVGYYSPASRIDGRSKEELLDLMASCYGNVEEFGRLMFPEHFSRPFSSLHRKMARIIDQRKPKTCVVAPRGIGKTTTLSIGLAGHDILMQDVRFILYCSASHDHAAMQTENLRRELMTNPMVRKLFPDIRVNDASEFGEMFSKRCWVANGHTMVMPRGCGQQVRGLKWGAYRPDLIIVDDLEDDENILSEEQRRKTKEWFFGSLSYVVAREGARLVYIDTLKHQDALIQSLLDSPDYAREVLPLCDETYNSFCPEWYTNEDIMREVESHRSTGTLDVFYREKMCMPIATEDACFRPEHFRHYDEATEGLDRNPDVENIVIVDPAKSAKPTSAYSAVVGVGINLKTNTFYVRDVVNLRCEKDALIAKALDMCRRFRAVALGVEVTGLNEWVEWPFKNAMAEAGMHCHFVPLHAKRGRGEQKLEDGKVGRIAALSPYYRRGLVKHNRACCGVLETQLLSFPRSRNWDVMDAFAYAIEMLEYGDRYFWPQRAYNDDGSYDYEAEYADLERTYSEPAFAVPDVVGFHGGMGAF